MPARPSNVVLGGIVPCEYRVQMIRSPVESTLSTWQLYIVLSGHARICLSATYEQIFHSMSRTQRIIPMIVAGVSVALLLLGSCSLLGMVTGEGSQNATDISQCRSIAVGHKSCGGPASWVVYSNENIAQSAAIVTLASLCTFYQRTVDAFIPTASDCGFESEPLLILENGKCEGRMSFSF